MTKDEDERANIVIDGLRYHHVTGFLESMRHRENKEFSEAIRAEKSPTIAREMGSDAKILWADLDVGKRPLTESEIRRFERDEPALRETARLAKSDSSKEEFTRTSWRSRSRDR